MENRHAPVGSAGLVCSGRMSRRERAAQMHFPAWGQRACGLVECDRTSLKRTTKLHGRADLGGLDVGAFGPPGRGVMRHFSAWL